MKSRGSNQLCFFSKTGPPFLKWRLTSRVHIYIYMLYIIYIYPYLYLHDLQQVPDFLENA